MLRDALTDLAIRGLKPRAGERYEVFDSKLPGFAVRVAPSGVKSFVLLLRQFGRQRRITIGRYPEMALADARRLARKAMSDVGHGHEPLQDDGKREKAGRFSTVVDSFVELHCQRHNRASTARETTRLLKRHFVAAWGNRDIKEITRRDINAVLDALVEHAPGAANRALSAIRKLFNWCVERGILDVSPCTHVKPPAPNRSRDRVLTDGELARIWRAAGSIGFPFGTIVQLLVLTAQRRGEVTNIRWAELDLGKASWTIPAERTKSNRIQHLPLVSEAVELLARTPQLDDVLVFPAVGGSENAFSGFSKSLRRLMQVSKTEGWTLHDLRRTAATGMAKLGVAPHVIERVLNHTSGTFGGVAGVYNRFAYAPEMRAALELWAKHVMSLANHDGEKRGA